MADDELANALYCAVVQPELTWWDDLTPEMQEAWRRAATVALASRSEPSVPKHAYPGTEGTHVEIDKLKRMTSEEFRNNFRHLKEPVEVTVWDRPILHVYPVTGASGNLDVEADWYRQGWEAAARRFREEPVAVIEQHEEGAA